MRRRILVLAAAVAAQVLLFAHQAGASWPWAPPVIP